MLVVYSGESAHVIHIIHYTTFLIWQCCSLLVSIQENPTKLCSALLPIVFYTPEWSINPPEQQSKCKSTTRRKYMSVGPIHCN